MLASAIMSCNSGFGEGESFLEAHVQLSVGSALPGPDAEAWHGFIGIEEARPKDFETWVRAADECVASSSQILPIATILSVKRCGRMKARAVVVQVGSLDRQGDLEVFAPVVLHAGNRLLFLSLIHI